METVEMDLMQAQIGSLATDVSRLEARVAAGGGSMAVTFTDVTPTSANTFSATASHTGEEITDALLKGIPVIAVIDGRTLGLGVIQVPVHATSDDLANVWGWAITGVDANPITITGYISLIIPYDNANAYMAIH